MFAIACPTCGGWAGCGIIRAVKPTFHSIARNARRMRVERLHGILPPPPPIRLQAAYAASTPQLGAFQQRPSRRTLPPRFWRTNVTKAALRADTKGCFVLREAVLVVFVRRNAWLTPNSASEGSVTVRRLQREPLAVLSPYAGSKFCQRRFRHCTQAPTGAVGGFVGVRRLQILPAEVSSRDGGMKFWKTPKQTHTNT